MTNDSDKDPEPKTITGYCEPWSLRAGEPIRLMASSSEPGPARLSLVRLHCGDPTRSGPGFSEEEVWEGQLPASVDLTDQPLQPGSFATVDLDGLVVTERLVLDLWVWPTRPGDESVLAAVVGPSFAFELMLVDGVPRARISGADLALRSRPLANRRWYRIQVEVDLGNGTVQGAVTTPPSPSPARDLAEPDDGWVRAKIEGGASPLTWLVLAGDLSEDVDPGHPRGRFDGRLARPCLTVDDDELRWDLAEEMDGPQMIEVGDAGRHGRLHQLPTRAVTGPGWDGTTQRWTDDPSQWDAVHFHTDDLYDAGWTTTAETVLPGGLPSGIYAFRLESMGPTEATAESGEPEVDRIPFFVRPAAGAQTADVALLASTATYLAYANHRMLFEGADFIASRNRLRPEHDYVRRHPEVGRSMYERHLDGSGVMFSSRNRPVLNLRPGADGWNFTPDTDLNAFLEHLGVGHDVIADEDLHADGLAALAPYRVIVTSSHPEYWSTAMLDALAEWQRRGGRLLYLGGNGFYWRVAFSDRWPGAMELRRAEDGVRNWETGPGESYHAWGGEYGGMWRRIGRAPNELVGIGFAAQGFGKAIHYDVDPDSFTGRTAWVWEGVELIDGRLGTSGLGGGAAGQEVDRYDTRLGSPDHAVVLASATGFGPDMVRTKEEFGGSVIYPTPDPMVRADIVLFETPGGGAVFSVGSISWFGALARNGYDNDVATMTTNVIRRFANPTPFPPPPVQP